jgi:hypothetical protein
MANLEVMLNEAGLDKTHWGKRILKAAARGSFTPGDRVDSGGWVSCACGKLVNGIPRERLGGPPIDPRLYTLGCMFSDDVDDDEFFKAANTLINIEDRAIQVLNELQFYS